MRTRLTAISAVILLAFSPVIVSAQGLSIGSDNIRSQVECNRFCKKLVLDCDRGIYHPLTQMCTIITHRPPFYSGIALSNLSQTDCDRVEMAMGTRWDMIGEWCVELPPKPPKSLAGAPDLRRVFDSSYNCVHLTRNGNNYEGWYDVKTKTIQGTLSDQSGTWVFEGDWGRTNSNNAGGFRWEFFSSTEWYGSWWYSRSPASTTPWNSRLPHENCKEG